MKILIKKKTTSKQSFTHSLLRGRVAGEDNDNRANEPKVRVELLGFEQSLSWTVPVEYDKDSHSGHQLAALFGGRIPEDYIKRCADRSRSVLRNHCE